MKKKAFKDLKIAVVMGGLSSEREISLRTGKGIYNELKKHGHKAAAIDLKRRDIRAVLKPRPDVVVNALHGTYGEDGVMQGMLDFHGIPYTGSGVLASALAMNKAVAKMIFKAEGIPTPAWKEIYSEAGLRGIKYPSVIKPCAEGSAVSVFIVKSKKQAAAAFKKAKKHGLPVIAEEYIKGTEISVPVLDKKALPVIEIVPANEFYDYDAKYSDGKSEHIIPARISAKLRVKAAKAALSAHAALGCSQLSRTDIIIRKGKLFVLEVNTLPGMTSVSLFPESAKAAGISFYRLLCILIKGAYKGK